MQAWLVQYIHCTRRKIFLQKIVLSRDGPVKSTETRHCRDEMCKKTTLRNRGVKGRHDYPMLKVEIGRSRMIWYHDSETQRKTLKEKE